MIVAQDIVEIQSRPFAANRNLELAVVRFLRKQRIVFEQLGIAPQSHAARCQHARLQQKFMMRGGLHR